MSTLLPVLVLSGKISWLGNKHNSNSTRIKQFNEKAKIKIKFAFGIFLHKHPSFGLFKIIFLQTKTTLISHSFELIKISHTPSFRLKILYVIKIKIKTKLDICLFKFFLKMFIFSIYLADIGKSSHVTPIGYEAPSYCLCDWVSSNTMCVIFIPLGSSPNSRGRTVYKSIFDSFTFFLKTFSFC